MAAASDVSAKSWLACRVGAHVCALPLTGVIETMRALPIEAFPRAPVFVSGLSIVRGQAAPVVDIGILMGGDPGQRRRFVTVKIEDRVVALAFDAVLGVYAVSPKQMMELPPLLKNVASEAVSKITTRDADLLLFFESARLFPPGFVETLMEVQAAG